MTIVDPRSALWSWVVSVRTIARRGTELADRLLDLVVARPADRRAVPVGGLQAVVEESKFRLGGDGGRHPPERDPGALPRGYGRDRIVLLPRDPWTVFAYWEITPDTRREALRFLGPEGERAREVLRVYDVTFLTATGDPACLAFDVEPAPDAASAYVGVSRPSASYRVEIGWRTPANRFLPVARSNEVTLPPASPSGDAPVRWAEPRRHPRPLTTAGERPDHFPPDDGTPSSGPFVRGVSLPPPPLR